MKLKPSKTRSVGLTPSRTRPVDVNAAMRALGAEYVCKVPKVSGPLDMLGLLHMFEERRKRAALK